MLLRIMPQMGMDYKSSVTELDIDDAGALADIMMLNVETVPTLNIGMATLTGDPILDESILRRFIESNIKPSY